MTRLFDKFWLKPSIAQQMKARALEVCGGFPKVTQDEGMRIIHACTAQYNQKGLSTVLIYTMDDGMHDIGWWKNPDFARCLHLSLSYWYPDNRVAPKSDAITAEWLQAFFAPNERWLWMEPAYTIIGKKRGVWHYRLFAGPHWEPILPEGEVYSTLKTEKGWLSYSELQDKLKAEAKEKEEHVNNQLRVDGAGADRPA